ncbi:hypothetical protein KIPB_007180, partial [Kipferlia bialata]|eukprot:g7180.t1
MTGPAPVLDTRTWPQVYAVQEAKDGAPRRLISFTAEEREAAREYASRFRLRLAKAPACQDPHILANLFLVILGRESPLSASVEYLCLVRDRSYFESVWFTKEELYQSHPAKVNSFERKRDSGVTGCVIVNNVADAVSALEELMPLEHLVPTVIVNATETQVLVQWSASSPDNATLEDKDTFLRHPYGPRLCFPLSTCTYTMSHELAIRCRPQAFAKFCNSTQMLRMVGQ